MGQLRRARAAGFRDNADKTGLEVVDRYVRKSFRKQYALAILNDRELTVFLESLLTTDSVQ